MDYFVGMWQAVTLRLAGMSIGRVEGRNARRAVVSQHKESGMIKVGFVTWITRHLGRKN